MASIGRYVNFCNTARPHSLFGGRGWGLAEDDGKDKTDSLLKRQGEKPGENKSWVAVSARGCFGRRIA